MKMAYIIVRILLSLQLLVSIVFYILISTGTMPMPEMKMHQDMITFNTGVAASVYLMPLIKMVESLCVIAFLTNRYVALAAVMLFPISVNIMLLHAFLDPENAITGVLIVVANLFIAYVNREQYKGLFVAKP